ncbi:hypothetical protein L3X38_032245 [Prunus dulcis]|uniref:Uncharacterized protein n=1 Tax=Prunus dulcis TaxID=3755 RepID=A0AAD4VES0_PRUDU|nr:hypothetical protein L3X38_032245 [Prunus dulcis]
MGWGGETQTNLEVRTKLFKFGIVKLSAIVCDDGVGDAEATYNTLPHKGFDASRSDGGQGLGLSPLGEVVYSYDCIFDLALALGHRPNEI